MDQMLAQLEDRGLVKNLVRLDQAVELALAELVLPALVVISLRGAGVVSLFNSCRVVHEQH
eukprot:1260337-Pleurochrysis_carterae.AAC.1